LWAEQFDGDIADLFALQNEITSRIAIALNLELTSREASPRDWFAHHVKGMLLLRSQGRCEEAISEYETALALNPNWLPSLNQLAFCKIMTGSIEDAIPLVEQAIRLSPRDPLIRPFYANMGIAHLLQSHTDEAILCFEKARGTGFGWPYSFLAAIYGLRGEIEKAAANLAEARRQYPDGRYSSIARRKATGLYSIPGYWGVPEVAALFEATYFAGLRKAGMPEE